MQIVIDISEDDYKKVQDGRASVSMMRKAIRNGTPLDKIRAEISEYKDDKVIHAERNEMIDIVLEIIDKYKGESEDAE